MATKQLGQRCKKRLNKVSSSSKLLLWPSPFKFFVRNFATVRLDCWDGKSWICSSRETYHLSFFLPSWRIIVQKQKHESKNWSQHEFRFFFFSSIKKVQKKILNTCCWFFLRGWKNFPSWFSLKFLDEPSRENINHFESTIGQKDSNDEKTFLRSNLVHRNF